MKTCKKILAVMYLLIAALATVYIIIALFTLTTILDGAEPSGIWFEIEHPMIWLGIAFLVLLPSLSAKVKNEIKQLAWFL